MSCDCSAFSSKLNAIYNLVKGQAARIEELETKVAKLEEKDKKFFDRVFQALKGNPRELALIVGGLTIGGIQIGYGLKEAVDIREAVKGLSSDLGGKIARVENTIDATKADILIENGKVKRIAERANRNANSALSTATTAATTAGATAATVVSLRVAIAALGATVALLAPLFTLANEVKKIRNDLYKYVDQGDELNARLILNIQQSTKNRIDQLSRELDDIAHELGRLRADLKADISLANRKAQQALDAIPGIESRITVVQRDLSETKNRLETELRRIGELNHSQYTAIITEIRKNNCTGTIVRVPTPTLVDRPYPVKVPVPYPVAVPTNRPCPPPQIIRVNNPVPVTNTITNNKETIRTVPQIVKVATIKCPDPCPPPPEGPDLSPDIEEIKQRLNDIQNKECPECPDPVAIAAVPEYWQVPVGADRPQLVVIYAAVDPATGQPDRANQGYPLNIPHWNGLKAWGLLPRWEKGNCMARAVLRDNSRIILYAKSEFEAERAIKSALKFVQGPMLKGLDLYTGQVNANFKRFKCTPLNARYFPQGRLTEIPDFYKIQ